MPWNVRRATPADADAMGLIHVEAWRAAYGGGLMPADYLESITPETRATMWRHALNRPRPERSTTLVVEPSTRIVGNAFVVVGFSMVGRMDEGEDAGIGELYVINVAPTEWGSGAGQRLHDGALVALEDANFSSAVLWVHPDNARARAFYEGNGWTSDDVTRRETVLGVEVPEIRYSIRIS